MSVKEAARRLERVGGDVEDTIKGMMEHGMKQGDIAPFFGVKTTVPLWQYMKDTGIQSPFQRGRPCKEE